MSSDQFQISFRPIAFSDVPNLVRWQRDPDVEIWWGDKDKTDEDLFEKWRTRAEQTGTDYDLNTDRYIIVVDGHDIGHIQGYELRHYTDHQNEVGLPNAGGVDLFIGESEWRNRGVGTLVLRQFIEEKIFSIPGVEICTIDPDPKNKRAIRSYEKVGFTYVNSYYSEANKMNCYLMRLDKPAK